jgi:hypothetical protein
MKLALYVVARKSIQLGPLGSVSQSTHPFILHWSSTGLTSPTSIHWPYISTALHKKSKDSRIRRISKRIRSTGLCTVYIEASLRVRISTATISAATTTQPPIPLPRRDRIHIRTRRTYAAHPSTTATHMRAQQARAQRLRTPRAPARALTI